MRYLGVAAGLVAGNFVVLLFGISNIGSAVERSFFQLVAIAACASVGAFRSKR